MAIAYVGAGTNGVGTTSATPAYDAASPVIAAGDLFILNVASKYPANPPSTPNGWTLVGSGSGGQGASGADSGDALLTIFYKVATGAESGTETVSVTSGNSIISNIARFLRTDAGIYGDSWEVTASFVAESTAGTDWATSFTGQDLKLGDMVYFVSAQNTNLYTSSNHTITSGFTATTSSKTDAGTAQGDNLRLGAVTYDATSGRNDSGAISFAMTLSGTAGDAPAGVTALVRIRQVFARARAGHRGITYIRRAAKIRAPDMEELLRRKTTF